MDGAQVASYVIAGVSALGVILAYFKWKPGQREVTEVNVAQGSLNVAQGTIKLIASELEDQFIRMSSEQKKAREIHASEIAEERRSVAALRAELDAASKQVRELRADLRAAWVEVEEWRKHSAELEKKLRG